MLKKSLFGNLTMPMQPTPATDLVEIFSSIQGEGILLGYRQIFIRFPDCNLNCDYCDTEFTRKPHCLVESAPGSGSLGEIANPISFSLVRDLIAKWYQALPGAHHSISITGGEPLLHVQCLEKWLPGLRCFLPIYLETNGTLVHELEAVIEHVDWVSMDIKLHSQTGERTDWQVHRDFLKVASHRKCYVKVVVGEDTSDLELQLTADVVAGQDRSIPVVLQPVTRDGKVGVSVPRLLEMQAIMTDIYSDVRIIPQTHRFLCAL